MDLFAPLDLYCERTDTHLLSEPLNLISNLAFIVAGYMILRNTRAQDSYQNVSKTKLLAWQIIAVGIGSGLFHSFANRWSQLCDVMPIGILLLTYIWLFCRHVASLNWLLSAGAIILFLVLSAAVALLADPLASNGGQFYFGTWITLLALSFYLSGRGNAHSSRPMLLATLLFALSIFMRTVDLKICDEWPWGTHVFWHILNAFVLYLVINAYSHAEADQQHAHTREG